MFKRNNNRKGLIFILIFVFVFIIVSNISLIKLIKIPSDFYVSYDEIDRANKEDLFGNFVELKLKEKQRLMKEKLYLNYLDLYQLRKLR